MFYVLRQRGAVLIPEALRKTIILRLDSMVKFLLSEGTEVDESSIETVVQQGHLRIAQILRKCSDNSSRKEMRTMIDFVFGRFIFDVGDKRNDEATGAAQRRSDQWKVSRNPHGSKPRGHLHTSIKTK
jgi:hypothetical protein